jgi:RNA polymerase sigma-70 factor, ECF subfamily
VDSESHNERFRSSKRLIGQWGGKIKNLSPETRFNSSMLEISPDIDTLLSSSEPDQDLIVRALVDAYRTPLYQLAVSILQDTDEAHDAVQETFITVMLNLSKYQAGTNFRAWLYRLALNTCRGHLRKRRTREMLQRSLMLAQPRSAKVGSVEQTALEEERKSDLWTAVDGLNERHRLVILLRFKQQLSIREIAQVLETNEKTVYNRLYDAFRKLRIKLEVSDVFSNFEKGIKR